MQFAFKAAVTSSSLYRLALGREVHSVTDRILRLFQTSFKDTPGHISQFLLGENSEARMLLSTQQSQSLCWQLPGCFPGPMLNTQFVCFLTVPRGQTGFWTPHRSKAWDTTVRTYTGSWPWGREMWMCWGAHGWAGPTSKVSAVPRGWASW